MAPLLAASLTPAAASAGKETTRGAEAAKRNRAVKRFFILGDSRRHGERAARFGANEWESHRDRIEHSSN